MLIPIALVLLVLVGGLLAYAATRPATMRVQRTTTIAAPPDIIFPLINDFHAWTAWSPYENRDPGIAKTYKGPAQGPGAVYEWRGNRQVGEGRMEIASVSSPSRITIDLRFVKPFACKNIATFTLVPDGGATIVSWIMEGPIAFIPKLMGIFMSMDNMVGRDFAIGLENLKALAERTATMPVTMRAAR